MLFGDIACTCTYVAMINQIQGVPKNLSYILKPLRLLNVVPHNIATTFKKRIMTTSHFKQHFGLEYPVLMERTEDSVMRLKLNASAAI